jgi:hypothetical protein
MLVQEKKLHVERSSNFQENEFKIKACAEAFEILSSGLYSNNVQAILRELGTNAYDSQVAADTEDKPFTVHLPNSLEPFFSIRDYGTGLSEDSIKELYTTYFSSDKTKSNEFTGCLGLGSKSPFSYTDSFTVVDYFNGVRYTYTAMLNDSGFPCIALMGSETTGEPNGLEISFPVKLVDFGRFYSEASSVYNWFKVKPVITGRSVSFSSPETPLFTKEIPGSSTKYSVYKHSRGSRVIMGNVCYPISWGDAGISVNNNVFQTAHYDIEIYANIGDVNFTASRESLKYTELTKKTARGAVESALAVFRAELEVELNKCATYWDACKFFHNNQLFLKNVQWRGRPLVSTIYMQEEYIVETFEWNYNRIRCRNPHELYKVNVYYSAVFIDKDIAKGARERIRQYLNEQKKSGHKLHTVMLVHFKDDAERAAFQKELDLPADVFIKASTLPKVVKTRSKSNPTPKAYEFVLHSRRSMDCWASVEVDLKQGGVYVVLDGWNIEGFSADQLRKAIDHLHTLGHNVKLYGVRKALLKKVAALSNWQTLNDFVKTELAKLAYDKHLMFNWHEYTGLVGILAYAENIKDDDLTTLAAKVKLVESSHKKLSAAAWLTQFVLHEPQPNEFKLIPELNRLEEKYPLFVHIVLGRSNYVCKPEQLCNYVEMCQRSVSNSN